MKRALLPALFAWLSLAACAGSLGASPNPKRAESRALAWIERHVDEQTAFLETTVNITSGTMNVAGVHEVGEVYKRAFDAIGMETEWVHQPKAMGRAGHLVARTKSSAKGKRLLLIGHLDTVFEPESPFQRFERKGEYATGPGVIDMKGGNAVILYALRALHAAGVLHSLRITVVLSGDEERPGKPLSESRKLLVAEAKAADAALGFESIVDTMDTATIARRGFRAWTLTATGNQGHSSQVFGEAFGYGAIYEVARILNAFRETLSSQENLTFSPGLVAGGTDVQYSSEDSKASVYGKSNVIAKAATANGDLCALSPEQVATSIATMKAIVSKHLPGTSAELVFEEGYPPMAPTEANQALLELLSGINQELGRGPITAVAPSRRGAADISFAAPHVASMGGLGLFGEGAHAPQERLDLRSLPVSTSRAALLIYRLCRQAR